MRTTAIFNLKGGVAKTITTAAMADILAIDHKKRVLVIDADGQGNLSQYFGVDAQEGASTLDLLQGTHEPVYSDWVTPARPDVDIDIIPADMTLMYADIEAFEGRLHSRHAMEELRQSIEEDAQSPDADARAAAYDYMLIDCPPAFSAASAAALIAADDVVIPAGRIFYLRHGRSDDPDHQHAAGQSPAHGGGSSGDPVPEYRRGTCGAGISAPVQPAGVPKCDPSVRTGQCGHLCPGAAGPVQPQLCGGPGLPRICSGVHGPRR